MQTKKEIPAGGASNALLPNCSAPSMGLNMDQHPDLMDYLPKEYEYHVCRYKDVSQPSPRDHTSFEATLRMTLTTREDIQMWLKSLPDTWRVGVVRPRKGHKIIFKAEYRCQHKTRTPPMPGRASKNTNCSAKLKITILRTMRTSGRLSRRADPHIPAYPTIVEISHVHNHNLHDAAALRVRDVGSAVVAKLTELFKAGHSPPSALDALKYELRLEHGDDYSRKSADRSICPNLRFCYSLYEEVFKAEYGGPEGQVMLEQAPLHTSSGLGDHSPEMAMMADGEESDDAQTSAEQPASRSTMASTEGVVGDEESDVDDDEFRSKMRDLTETLLINKRELKGGLKAMMKAIDKMAGRRATMLLVPSALLSAMHTLGGGGADNSPASRRAQNLRRVTDRAVGPGTAAAAVPVTSVVARPKLRLGVRHRPAAGRKPGRKPKNRGPPPPPPQPPKERTGVEHPQLVPSGGGAWQHQPEVTRDDFAFHFTV